MKWSLYIGKPAGIRVYIHWTFILLIIWISWLHLSQGHGLAEIAWGFSFLAILFVCITLHEYGHALTARIFGIGTKDINLLPIGGAARLERMPENPWEELMVALAGPAVNAGIAAGLYALKLVLGQPELMFSHHVSGSNFIDDLLLINMVLVVFNLIPAFPMDGGRVLRALLSFKVSRFKATQIAAGIGQFLAILFVLFGLLIGHWLIFIGVFVFIGAGSEAKYVAVKEYMRNLKARDLMTTDYPSISGSQTVSQAVSICLEHQCNELVVEEEHTFVGLVTYRRLLDAAEKGERDSAVRNLCQANVITFTGKTNLQPEITTIRSVKQNLFPVLKANRVTGVVFRKDIAAHLSKSGVEKIMMGKEK